MTWYWPKPEPPPAPGPRLAYVRGDKVNGGELCVKDGDQYVTVPLDREKVIQLVQSLVGLL